ncbi:MAG: metal ABC transporter permease [Candidatus Phytoplasma stylosanthis]|uniref:metal ABC transporter permease n=1 Tax=Candidatus Phytoplasma stylosanthis TaxID=2798314 RepID=UPI00293AC5F9|nr:metal ABC transporter permease [Candidatus Phytoplasma stylosanthis]MDV3168095.1 metal ABC transporter permease [Candidatus Phytoplasma stylosanthis]MDV3170706.1 metal ABC transporter permease [Candidatus Phytoplasma stylosanthis]MDV3173963.1 metal ABC transporter permease [Candidatus Phytoplasma stylosanthis]MDV3202663.1 metal ABC transporter permease [Candidatus Phytoplasma stylosanthis]
MIDILNKIVNYFETDVFLVLIFSSLSLANLGVFLILKRFSMIIDAISHSVLLGIVIAYLITKNLNSPFLIIGATLIGILTFYLIELISKNNKISKDSAIGIVFTFFFSIAIIIISTKIRGIHIDSDAVFLGNIELTNISQLYKIIPIFILNILFVVFIYKELKISIFDPSLSNILGFSTVLINYLLMTLVSVTVVISFDVVGSVMSIICMIGPASTAILLTKKLWSCWLLSLWIAFISVCLGYYLGIYLDLPVSGIISVVILVIFLIILCFEPKNGIFKKIIRNYFQKKNFMIIILLMHLDNNISKNKKNYIQEVKNDLKWSVKKYKTCLLKAIEIKYIKIEKKELILTEHGKKYLYEKNKKFFSI